MFRDMFTDVTDVGTSFFRRWCLPWRLWTTILAVLSGALTCSVFAGLAWLVMHYTLACDMTYLQSWGFSMLLWLVHYFRNEADSDRNSW